jgi:hypothetical protein
MSEERKGEEQVCQKRLKQVWVERCAYFLGLHAHELYLERLIAQGSSGAESNSDRLHDSAAGRRRDG